MTDPKQDQFDIEKRLEVATAAVMSGIHDTAAQSGLTSLLRIIDELSEERDNAYHRGYNAAIEDAACLMEDWYRFSPHIWQGIRNLKHQVGTEPEGA
jgi:hypothetical protein